MEQVAVRPPEFIIVSLLGLVVALGITLLKPGLGLLVAAGFLVLLIALSSTQAALYLLIVSMLLSPEIGLGQVQGKGVGGRELSIRMDDILLIVIGLSWLAKMIVYRELALFRYTAVNRPILYYMLACVVATLLGVLAGRVRPLTGFFFVLKYFEYFFIFFMVVNHVRTREQTVQLVIALLATCFLISLYALLQTPAGQRATAPFEGESGEPNTLGGYLVLIMALSIGLLIHVPSMAVRIGLFVLLGLNMLALMATLSRSSYLAASVLLVAVGVTQWRKPAILGVVVGALLVIPLLAPGNVKERVGETFYGRVYGTEIRVLGVHLDSSTSERIRSWITVLEGWSKRPLFGHGITGYAWADAQYVKILGETGLAGIVTFVFLMSRLWRKARDAFARETDPFCKGLAHGFLLGLAAMLVHGIGANTFIIIRIMEPFWLCAGLVLLLPIPRGKPGDQPGQQAVP